MVILGETRDLGIVPGPGAGEMTQQLGTLALMENSRAFNDICGQ